MVVYSHIDFTNLITTQNNLSEYTLSNFYGGFAEIEDLNTN